MDDHVKLGRIFGIPIGLHWSWFLIFIIVTWTLASGIFAIRMPGLPVGAYWGLATITSLLLFASVLAHEFGHAVLSIRNHIGVRRITLFIFGGVAQIEQEPQRPGIEFRIAIAGPAVSLALGLIFGGLFLATRSLPWISAPSEWLAQVNLTLAIFNMIPAFPLDGGRVLRAIVWAITRNYKKSTRIATYTAQAFALAFVLLGVFSIVRGNFAGGLWMMFIGWFLNNAAQASRQQMAQPSTLDDVRVTQVMDHTMAEVAPSMLLDRLVCEKIMQGGHRSFLVSENQRPLGLVTIRDVISIPRPEWSLTPVHEIMVPWERLVKVSPDAYLSNVLYAMDVANLAQVPVVYNNQVEGLLTREQILRYLRMRS